MRSSSWSGATRPAMPATQAGRSRPHRCSSSATSGFGGTAGDRRRGARRRHGRSRDPRRRRRAAVPAGRTTPMALASVTRPAPLCGRRAVLRRSAGAAHDGAALLDDVTRIGRAVLVALQAATGVVLALELRRAAAAGAAAKLLKEPPEHCRSVPATLQSNLRHSSSGLGHRPLTAAGTGSESRMRLSSLRRMRAGARVYCAIRVRRP